MATTIAGQQKMQVKLTAWNLYGHAGTTDSYQRFYATHGIKLVGLLLVRWDRHVTVTEAGLMNRLQAITTSLEQTPTNLSCTFM